VLPTVLAFDSRDRLDAFTAALQAVVDRHDVLRTAVMWEGLPQPVQVVARQAGLPVEHIELPTEDGLTHGAPERLLAACPTTMDLASAPLLRAYIAAEPGSERWLLLVQQHHLVVDHTALGLLLSEVRAVLAGETGSLPEPRPYRDFVAQARLGSPDAEHERFFSELLGDVAEPTAPFGVLDVRGDAMKLTEARLSLAPELAARLREQARRRGISAATLFHLAWARVVAATSNRDDVVFGTVLFGRMSSGERVPGLFINTLPIRTPVAAVSVTDALAAMRTQLADLVAHEHASLALAQKCSGVEGSAPLFTALLNYRHGEGPGLVDASAIGLPGVEVVYVHERTNYPLTLTVDDFGDAFALTVQAVDPIDAQSVCDLVDATLAGVADAMEHTPGTVLANVDVLGREERQRLIVEWNDTFHETPSGTLPELFAA
ncbi:condensation domain-containing protein, partial [Streptomyces sp. NPDC007095]|uniref:condensation domain-containing protein n=1 Tax=Streptomyces sp. NPDC007095 TaxID=3154482 RepID=UPI0033C2DA8A